MRLYFGSSVSSKLSSYYSKRTKSILFQYGCFWLSTFVNIYYCFLINLCIRAKIQQSKLEAPSTSKFEAISLAVSRPLPEQRHSANQPAEQVNFKPTVGFNVCPVATFEDELQASFQSVFPKLPEPRKTPTSAPFVSSTSQMHPTSFLTPLHSQKQVIPSIASLKLPPVDMPTFSG